MYPYSSNTQGKKSTLEMKEALGIKETLGMKEPKKKMPPALAQDRRLLEILELAKQETADMTQRYAKLMTTPALAPSAEVVRAMYLDELKHLKQLQECSYLISGENQSPMPQGNAPDEEGSVLLEDTLLLELDNGDFFRTLYLSLPNEELRDIFFEIAADKQNHCTGLTYLFSKYFT